MPRQFTGLTGFFQALAQPVGRFRMENHKSSYRAALARVGRPHPYSSEPPTTSTEPSRNRVAVCPARGPNTKGVVADQVLVAGSYNSLVSVAVGRQGVTRWGEHRRPRRRRIRRRVGASSPRDSPHRRRRVQVLRQQRARVTGRIEGRALQQREGLLDDEAVHAVLPKRVTRARHNANDTGAVVVGRRQSAMRVRGIACSCSNVGN